MSRGIIGPFFRKLARRDRYSQYQQDTAEATLDVLRPEDRIINRRADVVWPPRNCHLTPLDYYLWGAVKDKCYTDKPDAIDALKDNMREAIGEIQMHTIECVRSNVCVRLLNV